MFLTPSHKTFNSMTSVVYQPPLAPLSRLDAREPVTRRTCITDINDFLIMILLFCFGLSFQLTILLLGRASTI
ncbi:hypothetical protein C8R48DRAFT_12528 [Suillus tomentosus]|nr:hypothetical protein C8R48DRAFT_12528 [Suillus tomentosus]